MFFVDLFHPVYRHASAALNFRRDMAFGFKFVVISSQSFSLINYRITKLKQMIISSRFNDTINFDYVFIFIDFKLFLSRDRDHLRIAKYFKID